jgi:hypothetical protein
MPADPKGFPSHRQFLDSVAGATFADFSQRPAVKVSDPEAFLQMRDHILSTASPEGTVLGSFVDRHGQVFDRVPVELQSSLRKTGAALANPIDLEGAASKPPGRAVFAQSQLAAGQADKFGNAMQPVDGTIAVRRVTLEELTRFGSLQRFLRKSPVGRDRHPHLSPPEEGSQVHKYAHAFQDAPNIGGHASISIWDPSVGSQVFSLAQHWYAGGDPIQTVECGWQVFPQKYQNANPVLFVYWTADGYSQTGAYNLDAPGFVQTSSAWALGAALPSFSSDGQPPVELEIYCQLIQNNWWIYLNGSAAVNALGYFPADIYAGGQMAANATSVDYGGEVVNQTFWPPMGSGAFASAGLEHAAYFRNIFYYDPGRASVPAQLNPVQASASCYTLNLAADPDPWNENFYFGGPGGNACP